jgi:CDP-4-dehydro-6-deoxyglucose reductase
MPYVHLNSGKIFEAANDISLLEAATMSGVSLPYSCKTGRCSSCKCRVLSGKTKALVSELGLTEKEKSEGWILSCVRSVETEVVLDVEDLGDVLLPEARTLACRISRLDKLAPDVIKVILRLPPNAIFNFIPGQYIDIIGTSGIRRSYSLANAPKAENTLELHIRAVKNGEMSEYWFNQSAVNDLLRLYGPQGTFFLRNIAKRDLIFLATGTGLAPVKAMLESLPSLPADQQPASITLVWGARHECDLYFDVATLTNIQKYIPVLSQAETAWQGERGYIQDALLRRMPDLRNGVVYACGSYSMIHSAKSTLTAAGLYSQHFYSDAFVCSSTLAL